MGGMNFEAQISIGLNFWPRGRLTLRCNFSLPEPTPNFPGMLKAQKIRNFGSLGTDGFYLTIGSGPD